eukprot:1900940-Amphidinium_carterae.1
MSSSTSCTKEHENQKEWLVGIRVRSGYVTRQKSTIRVPVLDSPGYYGEQRRCARFPHLWCQTPTLVNVVDKHALNHSLVFRQEGMVLSPCDVPNMGE